MTKQYRKKPVVIEAIQWGGTRESLREIQNFYPDIIDLGAVWFPEAKAVDGMPKTDSWPLAIRTLEGTMTAEMGDFIIKGVKGEFYPCKPDIFRVTYEEVTGHGV